MFNIYLMYSFNNQITMNTNKDNKSYSHERTSKWSKPLDEQKLPPVEVPNALVNSIDLENSKKIPIVI